MSSVEEMWPSMNEPDEMSYNNSPSSFRYESRSSWSSNSCKIKYIWFEMNETVGVRLHYRKQDQIKKKNQYNG